MAIASSETQYVGSMRSCYEIKRRDSDGMFFPDRGSRGDTTRETLLDAFLERKEYDAILCLDADQRHPDNLLDSLRDTMEAGDLDMVCAHYYKRGTKPIQSLCYELGDGTWPYIPMLDPPTDGVVEIASTGLGCVLIRRRVVEAVRDALPKDMSPFAIAPMPELTDDYNNFGSDFRFFILARRMGFRLWLDASVESLHATIVWLGHKSAKLLVNYTDWADGSAVMFDERIRLYGVNGEAFRQRQRILEARKRGLVAQLEEAKAGGDEEKAVELSIALYSMDGRLLEMAAWMEWVDKYPKIERPSQLPTTANTPKQETFEAQEHGAEKERAAMYRDNAVELVGELPNRGNGLGRSA